MYGQLDFAPEIRPARDWYTVNQASLMSSSATRGAPPGARASEGRADRGRVDQALSVHGRRECRLLPVLP